jgi:NAD-dependent deacetylase
MVWEWYEERRRGIAAARPNAGHEALVQMERQKDRFTLISQNVDGLHERAGSRSVIRLHGSIWTIRCTICGDEKTEFDELLDLPPRCGCGGIMRPGVVWFGEPLPEKAIERADDEVRLADVFIVAGTSAQVYPAAGLIPHALRHGVPVIEVNPDRTDFSEDADWHLQGTSAEILPRLL